MPQVLAGILTMADIALHAITQGEVYTESESEGTWAPGAWRSLPVTITVSDVPQGAKALILFNSSMRADYTGYIFFLRAVVDGVGYPESSITTESDGQLGRYVPSACIAFVPGLSAGTHTFEIQAMCNVPARGSHWTNLRHVVAIMKK